MEYNNDRPTRRGTFVSRSLSERTAMSISQSMQNGKTSYRIYSSLTTKFFEIKNCQNVKNEYLSHRKMKYRKQICMLFINKLLKHIKNTE